MSIRSNRRRLLAGTILMSIALMGAAPAAFAQQTPQPAASESEDVIVVTGTRRVDRSVTDSASPVDVIGGSELAEQPALNLLDVVKNVVPSFYVPQNAISDASTFVRAPSLRGLGADQVLVMINGKRYNRAALVQVYTGADTALSFGAQGSDIGNIPAIAIDNLQILRDGATAQYGSDAIGGVINYQISTSTDFEAQLVYGQSYEGDGERTQLAARGGFDLGGNGFVTLAAEWFDDKGTSRGATRPIALELARTNPAVANSIPNAPDGPAQIWGSSPTNGWKTFLNAGYDISDDTELYLTVNVAGSEADQSFNYRSPISAPVPLVVDVGTGTPSTRSPGRNGAFNNIFLTPCPTGNATCPAGGFVNNTNTFNFASVYPGGFTPRFIGEVDQAYGTGGIRGSADSGLTYDLSATFARNSLNLSMNQSLSASYGPQSQTSFKFGELIQTEQVVNADFTYPVNMNFASPVTLSAGAEYRNEEYENTPGDLQSYGAGPYARQPLYNLVSPGVYTPALDGTGAQIVAVQSPAASGYGGTSPTFAGKRSQSSYGIYAGAETDITSQFSMGAAIRYEDYSTFGSTVVGKLNGMYKVNDIFSLRATVGTGFHAPSPGQNNTQIVTTNFRSGNQVQTGTYPVTSAIAQYYGATSLDPEESTNFGAGFVLEPMEALTITVDGYSIKVKDRIGLSQTFTVTPADLTALPALAVVGVGGDVNYFTNGFDVKTEGVDAIGTYNTDLMGGDLTLSLAYNYNKSTVTDFNPAVISAAQRSNISNLAPKHRVVAAGSWAFGDWTVNGRANYYGEWSNALEYPGQTFGAKTLVDLDVSYTFADHYTLTVGANNLFDEYPDAIAPTTTNPVYALTNSLADGQVYPRSGGPFGMNGGFVYTRLRVTY
ncbi:Colicin I receptor [uncultured Defluviicoccus sp.]|uniref:Colicin I receptor n=1 Tax=metagenome TaxID=256318 RepID=A0A380T7C9_9ZZZZ|nr:Colicin I receptor [uncultured Defluviicoccus sp.]